MRAPLFLICIMLIVIAALCGNLQSMPEVDISKI
jgi:hypothetical protein